MRIELFSSVCIIILDQGPGCLSGRDENLKENPPSTFVLDTRNLPRASMHSPENVKAFTETRRSEFFLSPGTNNALLCEVPRPLPPYGSELLRKRASFVSIPSQTRAETGTLNPRSPVTPHMSSGLTDSLHLDS
ncbi:unnamed protein product [Pieris macdunnoughi]|uniref:Uncharacterized protein n=1 Tax=Pieris macdunnoughi TaxID=345717 RepID=A0A821VUB5_9NEOP|nr:unnamed protein product [Pieris macdunnoughi]